MSERMSEITKQLANASVQDDGTVFMPKIKLPISPLISAEARGAMIQVMTSGGVASFYPENGETWGAARNRLDSGFFGPIMEGVLKQVAVRIERTTIAGVPVDRITPAAGVAPENRDRVIVSIHCGMFTHGSGFIPDAVVLAHQMQIEVFAPDYRLAPEHKLSEGVADVAAVCEALAGRYSPKRIALYGISAGGELAAMTLSSLIARGKPLPGAVGILAACGGFVIGDSHVLAGYTTAHTMKEGAVEDFAEVLIGTRSLQALQSREFSPIHYPDILARFPPTLLMSSGRAQELSGTVVMHRNLLKANVQAELHVWEGLPHAFPVLPALPESLDFYDTFARFLRLHLN